MLTISEQKHVRIHDNYKDVWKILMFLNSLEETKCLNKLQFVYIFLTSKLDPHLSWICPPAGTHLILKPTLQ